MPPLPPPAQQAVVAAARREAKVYQKQKRDIDKKYQDDVRGHQDLLRAVLSAHRQGLDEEEMFRTLEDYEREELYLGEKTHFPPIGELCARKPPPAVQGQSGWVYHSRSFGCLRPEHWLRFLCIWIVESPIFDPFILLTILCNCITMAWASPLDPPGTRKQLIITTLDPIFLYIFTFELATKMIAYGVFAHRHSYLRDAWCQLDFLVVSFAWLPVLVPGANQFGAVRAIRAVRPLRALKRVPGMPVLVGSILKAVPALGNVAGLTGFLFLIFGIVGMNLFKGVRANRPSSHRNGPPTHGHARPATPHRGPSRALAPPRLASRTRSLVLHAHLPPSLSCSSYDPCSDIAPAMRRPCGTEL